MIPFLAFDWIPEHQLNMKLATSASGTKLTCTTANVLSVRSAEIRERDYSIDDSKVRVNP